MFTNATPADWTRARGILFNGARRAGVDPATADDMAQNGMMAMLRRKWKTPPEGPVHAARILRKQAQRLGWWTLLPDAVNAARRKATAAAEAQTVAVAQGRSVTPSPATMAEDAERLGVPVERVHAAHGIGPGALAEPGMTPSVVGERPAFAYPAPRPWLRLQTDPNPAATLERTHRDAYRLDYLTGQALDDYRAALAAARGA